MRRHLFLSAFVALSGFVLPIGAAPNVIVIFVDDLGWPDAGPQWSADIATLGLGVQGATDLLTPRIDSLARNGVRFTNGYVTCPVCSPSRAGLMTGRHQQRFGYEMNPGPSLEYDPIFGLPRTECTLGDRLKALGFATAWIGKSHLGALPDVHPVTRGFDQFFGFLEGHHAYCLGTLANETCLYPANTPPPWQMTPAGRAQLPRPLWDPIQRATAPLTAANQPVVVNETSYLTEAFGREIVSFIHTHLQQHPAQPFCIYAPFSAVHEPVTVTPGLLERTEHLFPGQLNSTRHKLAGMLLALDDAVGAILDKLIEYGQLENTLIFFSSDNGAPPADRDDRNGSVSFPLKGNKSSLYEGGIRVPYILSWPGTLAPRVVHAPVSTMDILPTCVEAAGGTIPAAWQLDGVSLFPYLRGEVTEPHPTMFWRVESGRADEMEPGPLAMRQGRWKLVKPNWAVNWELYDFTTENGLRETANVADAHPEKLQELIPLYEAWAATLPRPRWDYNDPDYVTPTFVLEDVRVGPSASSILAPEFLPGTDKFAWQDENGKLWRGTIDLSTGFPNSTPVEVTTGLAAPSAHNEGPQWGQSAGGASLYYTKPGAASHLQIWRSGTPLTAHATLDSFGARVSQEPSAPAVGMIFNRGTAAVSAAVVAADSAPASVATLPNQAAVARNGRWIPGTADVVYVRTGTPAQLARFNPATNTSVILTDDPDDMENPGSKTDAWAFYAPEFGYELCYACVVDRTAIAIYRDLHRGGGLFDRVATLALPAAETARFLFDMKPLQGLRGFNGVSWFSCVARQNNDAANPGASAVWLLGAGPDPAHRMPLPLPPLTPQGTQPRNDLCVEWKPLALRVSDPAGAGVASEPETVIGEREVFCYYTRRTVTGPAQLRLARTGLVQAHAEPSGFAGMTWTRDEDFTPGEDDVAGRRMGGTETTAMVAHDGKLFAATSSYGDNLAGLPTWTGAQVLVKDSAATPWRNETGSFFEDFRQHRSVEALMELTFSKWGTSALPGPVKHLVVSLKDVVPAVGGTTVSARIRTGAGAWIHSTVAITADAATALCFAAHLDRDPNNNGTDAGLAGGREMIFAGLTNGEIHRGIYNPNIPERLVWDAAPEPFANSPAPGAITGMARANGRLYAACAMRQDTPGGVVAGGLYVRVDRTDSWVLIYAWPTPLPIPSSPVQHRAMTALTTVPDPRGCAQEVLLGARSWPGVVELIDPLRSFIPGDAARTNPNAVTVELDVRDFFARLWQDDSVRSQDVAIGYTPFTPATDPVTGQRVHFLGVRIVNPADPVNAGTHFLIRHANGTWEAAGIPGADLRATRCFAVSPFASDAGAAIYAGGYDTGGQPAENTAWIMRGGWNNWPELTISPAGVQSFQLSWPFTSLDWRLEGSTDLTAWVPVAGKPARSLTGAALNVHECAPRQFFRLHRP